MQDYRNLIVYKEAYSLAHAIYELTKSWPSEELYHLTIQIRRSAHSVDSNICEGVSRNSFADSLRFLYTAYASLKETENHFRFAFDRGYVEKDVYLAYSAKIEILSKMLNNFISYFKKRSHLPKIPSSQDPSYESN
ncbi:TPA: four helix bundle protein [archaeon]|nr:four helix bundle protein [Candidatus Naiadarchaeales archaeon SRR2090159.bin1288]